MTGAPAPSITQVLNTHLDAAARLTGRSALEVVRENRFDRARGAADTYVREPDGGCDEFVGAGVGVLREAALGEVLQVPTLS